VTVGEIYHTVAVQTLDENMEKPDGRGKRGKVLKVVRYLMLS
jgi:hypothetical protein